MDEKGRRFSRFQVRCEGVPAWAVDARDRRYYFDGLRFWALGARSGRLTTSWQTPGHGWVHEDGCGCGLCAGTPAEGLAEVA